MPYKSIVDCLSLVSILVVVVGMRDSSPRQRQQPLLPLFPCLHLPLPLALPLPLLTRLATPPVNDDTRQAATINRDTHTQTAINTSMYVYHKFIALL